MITVVRTVGGCSDCRWLFGLSTVVRTLDGSSNCRLAVGKPDLIAACVATRLRGGRAAWSGAVAHIRTGGGRRESCLVDESQAAGDFELDLNLSLRPERYLQV